MWMMSACGLYLVKTTIPCHIFPSPEHQNFFGIDENLGPVALSIKRERHDRRDSPIKGQEPINGPCYQYRIILRTSEVRELDADYRMLS